jgi:hypothetical protein
MQPAITLALSGTEHTQSNKPASIGSLGRQVNAVAGKMSHPSGLDKQLQNDRSPLLISCELTK